MTRVNVVMLLLCYYRVWTYNSYYFELLITTSIKVIVMGLEDWFCFSFQCDSLIIVEVLKEVVRSQLHFMAEIWLATE